MSNIIPFDSGKVPAYLQNLEAPATNSELSGGIGIGFPVISYKGKVWAVTEGGTRNPILDDNDDPKPSIEVVIVRANPGLSKTYYPEGFEEGVSAPPVCFSHDGITPSPQAAEPQARKCAACKHAVFGSKTTDSGKKAKACSDAKRTAVVAPNELDKPMLLRVPAASLKDLANYADALGKRRVPAHAVVTRIGFDRDAAHPQFVYKATRYLTAEEFNAVEALREDDLVHRIIGDDEVQGELAGPADDIEGEPPARLPPPAPKDPAPTPPRRGPGRPPKASRQEVAEALQPDPEPEPQTTPAVSKPSKIASALADADDLASVLSSLDDE